MVWGHASIRDPDGRGVWMKASEWGFEEVTADRIVLLSPEGEVLAGQAKRHIEYPIHTELMAARSDVGCVVHTHVPAATAFAAHGVPLQPISHDGVPFVDPDSPGSPGRARSSAARSSAGHSPTPSGTVLGA